MIRNMIIVFFALAVSREIAAAQTRTMTDEQLRVYGEEREKRGYDKGYAAGVAWATTSSGGGGGWGGGRSHSDKVAPVFVAPGGGSSSERRFYWLNAQDGKQQFYELQPDAAGVAKINPVSTELMAKLMAEQKLVAPSVQEFDRFHMALGSLNKLSVPSQPK